MVFFQTISLNVTRREAIEKSLPRSDYAGTSDRGIGQLDKTLEVPLSFGHCCWQDSAEAFSKISLNKFDGFCRKPKLETFYSKKLSLELNGLCDTRWVERHGSLICFNDYLLQILQALQHISAWKDVTSSSKADCFIRCLTSTDFIISAKIINSIFTITHSLSITLQKKV